MEKHDAHTDRNLIGLDELRAFLQEHKRRNYSPKTLEIFRRSLEDFLSFSAAAGLTRLQDVTAETLEAYRRRMVERNLSERSVDLYLRSVRQLFRFLEETGRVFTNPAAGLVLPRIHRHLEPVPTPAEMRKLLAAPDVTKPNGVRDRAILEVAYSTGVRLGELHRMSVFDPDYDQGLVRVTGKGRKERTLPLGKQALFWLRRYVKENRSKLLKAGDPDETALWINKDGGKLSTIRLQQVARDYAKAAGVTMPMSIHAIRRACATHMLANDAHPVQLQMLLGHSSLRTLGQYLKVTIRDLKKAHRHTNPGR